MTKPHAHTPRHDVPEEHESSEVQARLREQEEALQGEADAEKERARQREEDARLRKFDERHAGDFERSKNDSGAFDQANARMERSEAKTPVPERAASAYEANEQSAQNQAVGGRYGHLMTPAGEAMGLAGPDYRPGEVTGAGPTARAHDWVRTSGADHAQGWKCRRDCPVAISDPKDLGLLTCAAPDKPVR